MINLNPIISKIILNINTLKTSMKKQKLSNWIKRLNYILPVRNRLGIQRHILRVKQQKKHNHANTNHKKVETGLLYQTRHFTKDKE